MLTGKLFAGLAGLLLVFAVLPKLHPTPPVPIYLQLVVALSCVIFGSTFLLAELCVRTSLNQTVGLVQFGFVVISVCVLVFEFDVLVQQARHLRVLSHPRGCSDVLDCLCSFRSQRNMDRDSGVSRSQRRTS